MTSRPASQPLARPPGRARQRRVHSIVEAARDVILEHGYDRASMEQIAAAAGVTKKTLYNHFPGKQALLGAVLATLSHAIGMSLHDDVAPTVDLAEGLRRYGRQFLRALARPPGLDVYRLAFVISRSHPEVARDLHMAALGQVMGALARFIEHKDPLRRIADPLQMARQFVAMLSFLVNAALLGAPLDLDDAQTQRYIDDAVRSVLAGGGWPGGVVA